MDFRKYRKEIWISAVMAIIILITFSASTYAWFTYQQVASTNQATARTGNEDVKLYMSSTGGSGFVNSDVADIVQVNQTQLMNLMPVSTDDLIGFVSGSAGGESNLATSFKPVENEDYYYHGRVYIKAEATGFAADTKVAIYLDQGESAGGAIVQKGTGNILQASRLGIVFNQQTSSPFIFYLDDTTSGGVNTEVGGTIIKNGQVLHSSNGNITAVDDPSIPLSRYTIDLDNGNTNVPENPLMELTVNEVYPIDVYFYLEGCDPECVDSIVSSDVLMHLAFYGILME